MIFVNISLDKHLLMFLQAWDIRDNAVSRKNACEIELATTRIDVMQINSQLMETIQKKVELSQQLEQWQVKIIYQHFLFLVNDCNSTH